MLHVRIHSFIALFFSPVAHDLQRDFSLPSHPRPFLRSHLLIPSIQLSGMSTILLGSVHETRLGTKVFFFLFPSLRQSGYRYAIQFMSHGKVVPTML